MLAKCIGRDVTMMLHLDPLWLAPGHGFIGSLNAACHQQQQQSITNAASVPGCKHGSYTADTIKGI